MKGKPLKSQFRITIVLIVLFSLLATIVTYIIGILLFNYLLSHERFFPANHYETQLPNIENYIKQQNSALLETEAKAELEQIIPLEGIDYQVLDAKGNFLYGSVRGSFLKQPSELFEVLNTRFSAKGKYVLAVPIISQYGDLSGAVLLAYTLQVSSENGSGQLWYMILIGAMAMAPFAYFVLAIIIFSKRFVARINQPLQMLMEAANQIKQKNLDFELSYRSNNELGQLCIAFSEMKDELRRSLSAQWRMEEERRAMTEALAHDLKTPLSLILGYSEALLDDQQLEKRDKQSRYLKIIKENAERSSALVRQMLYVTDLENSNNDLVLDTKPIAQFIQQKASNYELQAKQRGVSIITNIYGEADKSVRFDIDKMERILDNIVSNSLEYTPQGGQIQIDVTVQTKRASVVISNTGPSFSGKDLEHMFTRFYRGDEARGGKGNHSGLGLYIVKQLVEKMGGTVKAFNSESGKACISIDFEIDSEQPKG